MKQKSWTTRLSTKIWEFVGDIILVHAAMIFGLIIALIIMTITGSFNPYFFTLEFIAFTGIFLFRLYDRFFKFWLNLIKFKRRKK